MMDAVEHIGPQRPGTMRADADQPSRSLLRRRGSCANPHDAQSPATWAGGIRCRPYYLQKLGYFAFDAAVNWRVTRGEFAVAFERAFASVSLEIFAARWAGMSPIDRQVVAVVARSAEPRPSGDIEAEAHGLGVRPGAARLALRRLAARGHINRVASGHRGRYAVRDRLFQRYLELQTCEP